MFLDIFLLHFPRTTQFLKTLKALKWAISKLRKVKIHQERHKGRAKSPTLLSVFLVKTDSRVNKSAIFYDFVNCHHRRTCFVRFLRITEEHLKQIYFLCL